MLGFYLTIFLLLVIAGWWVLLIGGCYFFCVCLVCLLCLLGWGVGVGVWCWFGVLVGWFLGVSGGLVFVLLALRFGWVLGFGVGS